ncbi:MAG: DUF3611 family protein [Desulfobacterales bacterium]
MPNNSPEKWHPSNPEKLAGQFTRIGWVGFWLQLVMLIIPVLLLIYVLFFSSPGSAQRKGIDLSNYLTYVGLIEMAFTTFWFFRYTRVGSKIADPATRPSLAAVMRTLWIGLGASMVGILFSMVLMTGAVGRFLFILLATPQTGIPFAQAGGDPSLTLSAVDAVALTSLQVTLTAELIVLALSLWLLFKVTRPSKPSIDTKASGQVQNAPRL